MRKRLNLDDNRYEERVNATSRYNKTKWTTYTAGRGLGMGSALANHRNLGKYFGRRYSAVSANNTYLLCLYLYNHTWV